MTLLATIAPPAQAAESDWQAQLLTRRAPALEARARESLARDPQDEAALWYWGQQAWADPRVRAELLPRAEACVRDKPQSARCHHLLGLLIGGELMDAGSMTAIRRLGEVRERFERAAELAPNDYAMRRDLLAFHVEVPALMGGSSRQARQQADAVARFDAPRGRLLQAALAFGDGDFDAAERHLASVQPGADRLLAADLLAMQVDLGVALLEAKAAARARTWFDRLQQQDPDSADVQLGLGRAALAQKQAAAAIAAFERALQLNPTLRLHHRLGAAHEAAGDTAKAVEAYRRTLAQPASRAAAERARERLKVLSP